MDLIKAREQVVLAGKKLIESGLVARTWGNVSCRISDQQFVITPSGRAYDTLSPEEIVTVTIEDGSYSGNIKPSSEKDLHAEIYKQRKDVNFIIHTHQPNASAVSPLMVDIPVLDSKASTSIGNRVACAAYGLPGSQKLKREALSALARSNSKAILLAYHGAVCFGKDMEEAFQVASDLERACIDYTCNSFMDISGGETWQKAVDENALRDCFLRKHAVNSAVKEESTKPLLNSERTGESFILYSCSTADEPFTETGKRFKGITIYKPAQEHDGDELPPATELHREIYRRYKDVGAIIHTTLPDILAVSQTGKIIYPLLDDFAQIIGTSARTVEYNGTLKSVRDVAGQLKGNSAVMIKGNGALCCGSSRHDAFSAVIVLAKNCKAIINTTLMGRVKPINPLEALLMRYLYLKKYSKKI